MGHFPFAFSPSSTTLFFSTRLKTIPSARALWRSAPSLRHRREIAAMLSPNSAAVRSRSSSSGVHAGLAISGRLVISSPSARDRLGGDSGEAGRATRGDGGAVSWHGSARAISLLFPLHLQPICNCSSLIFLKITCSCLARERTAVSVRFIRMPIALGLSPVSANLRSLSSSACVHGREAKCSGSVIGPRAPRVKANQIQQISRCRRRGNGLPPGRSGQDSCQSNRRRRPRA
jgi:hypothetical protein